MQNLSVIMITRNRIEKLKRCIKSANALLPQAEIIVVDNCSNDGTIEFLRSNKSIRAIFLSSNTGVAKARNIGIRSCNRKYLMFIDDDAWIEYLDFQEIERYFGEHVKVAMIAPKILYPNGSIQESIRSFPTVPFLLWRGLGLYKIFPNAFWYKKSIQHNTNVIHEIDWSIGACQIFRRVIFDKLGLLDEGFFVVYDDVEFCYRLKNNGHSSIYWPNSTVYHEYSRISTKGLNYHLFKHILSIIRFFFITRF